MKLKIITLFFFVFFYFFYSFGQSPAGIWYFGKYAGLDFNLGTTPVVLTGSQMNTSEGCATLSDNFGNLLFYTDGIKVWNRNNEQMPNGFGLFGDFSSTQSAIIIPKPNNFNLYYIFTIDELAKPNGLNYSIVDMNLENGLGNVTTKNVQLLTPTLEKINAVKHFNELDYWLITHKYDSNSFYAYLISETGISNPIISNVGDYVGGGSLKTLGYLKSSPNGEYLAIANTATQISKVQIFNFDNINGNLNLLATIPFQNSDIGLGVYGVEFSNDNKLLYVSNIDNELNQSQIFQFDLSSEVEETIINSSYLVAEEFIENNNNKGALGALQLAPNKKIYIARNKETELAVINNPNEIGENCNFQLNGISLGSGISNYGLPCFVTSLFDVTFTNSNNCFGSLTEFNLPNIPNIINVNWNFGDSASVNNSSAEVNPSHQYTAIGNFVVTVIVQTTTNTYTYSRQISIVNPPVAYKPSNIIACNNTNTNTNTFNLLSTKNEILGSQSVNDYNVTYYATLFDANNSINELPFNYSSLNAVETIYARVEPINSSNCYAITSFQIILNNPPILEPDEELLYCKNNYPQFIVITSGNIQSVAPPFTYKWSTGDITPSIQINQAGNYSVEVFDANNCSSIRNYVVTGSEIASLQITVNNTSATAIVTANGIGNYEYSIDNANGPYVTNNTFSDLTSGEHTIYVKDIKGCGIASSDFSIINYPKFFTPNGDGNNDYWYIKADKNTIKSIHIFDRYGKLIIDLKPNEIWDGMYNGKNLVSTDYWVEIVLQTNEVIKGHFSLIR